MRAFTKTKHCSVRIHCPACRCNRAWRAAVGAPDICPHGVTAGDLPPVIDLAAIGTARLVICSTCDDVCCAVNHASDCRARAILGRQNFHCPQDRF